MTDFELRLQALEARAADAEARLDALEGGQSLPHRMSAVEEQAALASFTAAQAWLHYEARCSGNAEVAIAALDVLAAVRENRPAKLPSVAWLERRRDGRNIAQKHWAGLLLSKVSP